MIFTETMQPGDVLLLYTDGITDALTAHNEEFGLERLYKVLLEHADKSSQEIVSAVMKAVDVFAGDEPPFDDQTLLVLKREALTIDQNALSTLVDHGLSPRP